MMWPCQRMPALRKQRAHHSCMVKKPGLAKRPSLDPQRSQPWLPGVYHSLMPNIKPSLCRFASASIACAVAGCIRSIIAEDSKSDAYSHQQLESFNYNLYPESKRDKRSEEHLSLRN